MHQMDMDIIPASISTKPLPLSDELSFADLEPLLNSNQRTRNQFRPRAGKGGSASYQLRQYAEVTLGGGSLRKVVKLPEGEDENEWLAVNSEYDNKHDNKEVLLIMASSGGFLQPDQPPLRSHHRVLLTHFMP
jgi:hypothetical protein